MPITTSAKKSLRVSIRRRLENQRTKTQLKTAIKKASKNTIPQTFSSIDKAVKVGLMHENKAARLKSRLSKQFGLVSSAGTRAKPKEKTSKKLAKKK